MAKKFKKEEVVTGVIDFIKGAAEGDLLTEVAGELSGIVETSGHKKTASVYTVTPLTEAQKEAIKKKLEREINHEISLREVIDKKLLAGFKIKLGDWVYDASVAGQLESFKSEIYVNV